MKPIDEQIIIACLTGEATPEEWRRLEAWRAEDPEHEMHFRRLRHLWQTDVPPIAHRPGASRPSARDILTIADGDGREKRVGATTSTGRRGRRGSAPERERVSAASRFGWRAVAIAASLVLGVGLGVVWSQKSGDEIYGPDQLVTGVGESATVGLPDGTVVRLAPSSRVEFPERGRSREIILDGRAYFAVARREGEPFRVRTPAGDIQVLGTRFDVRARGGNAQVAVVEGTVEVLAQGRSLRVRANEVARTTDRGRAEIERVDNVYRVIDWLGDFLAFESTPLADVAREFERRFGIRIDVVDPALSDRTVTGWFADQTPEEMIAGICRVVEARCTLRDSTVRMEVSTTGPAGGAVRAAP